MFNKNVSLLLFFAFILLGIVISLQFKTVVKVNSEKSDEGKRYASLKNELKIQRQISAGLIERIDEKKRDIEEYEKAAAESNTRVAQLKESLQAYTIMAGETDVTGTGIVITLNDAIARKDSNVDIEDELIHDMDIVAILNELRSAKAQALAVNDERVIAISEQTCAGPTISVNKTRYATPFVIKAIGDVDRLVAQLNSPESIIKLLNINRIQVDIKVSNNIVIPKYNGDIDFLLKKAGGINE